MSQRLITVALAFGLIVLIIAFVMPSLIAAPTTPATATTQADTSYAVSAGSNLDVTLDDVDNETEQVSLTLHDTETGETSSSTINVTETDTLSLSGEDIDVTTNSIESNETASVTVTSPPMFGWSDPAKTFASNFGILFALLSFLIVAGLFLGVGL